MRILPCFTGMLLFVLSQMSSPEVSAHHSAHFSNAGSLDMSNAVVPITMVADTLLFCTEIGNAELPASNQVYLGEGHPDASSCSAHIWSTQTVTDACGGNVTYDVRLYLNDGIDFIQIVDPTAVALDLNQQAVITFDTRSSSLPSGHEISLQGVPYTNGSCTPVSAYHRLIWTVVNECDETTIFESLLKVEDCRKPVPICVGLSTVVVPSMASVTIWARDLESGNSVDDCTERENILYSFSGTEYQPSRFFDCSEICTGDSNGSPSHFLEIWMADGGIDLNCNGEIEWVERNLDFCTTFVVFGDPNGNLEACDCISIDGGRVRTPLGAGIGGVTVNLYSPSLGLIASAITNQLGYYEFPFLFVNPLLNHTYEPIKEDNYKNGVSTLDLIQIQKHLLGITPFDSPFELIAADANNSESVSALDLVEIRKLILGVTTEFDSPSWRFVPEDFVFMSPGNPWPFSESVTNHGLPIPNFIGVKVGDIHSANNFTTIEVRNAPEVLSLFIEDQLVTAGDFVEVSVFTENISGLLGMQFTMQTRGLEYEGVQPGLMNLSADGIANHHDALALSWAEISPVSSDKPQPLFTLFFKAKTNGHLHEMLDLNSSITKSEAYREADNQSEEGIEVMHAQLAFGSHSAQSQSIGYELYQNIPNPVADQTVIGFSLPETMPVVLSVYNIHGQLVSMVSRSYQRGYQEIRINANDIGGNGTYFYRLDAGSFNETKRLVMLQN